MELAVELGSNPSCFVLRSRISSVSAPCVHELRCILPLENEYEEAQRGRVAAQGSSEPGPPQLPLRPKPHGLSDSPLRGLTLEKTEC